MMLEKEGESKRNVERDGEKFTVNGKGRKNVKHLSNIVQL